jgi:hypothetical protein
MVVTEIFRINIYLLNVFYRYTICRVFRAQADWTLNLESELPAKELRLLPRKMLPCGTTYRQAPWTSDKPAE